MTSATSRINYRHVVRTVFPFLMVVGTGMGMVYYHSSFKEISGSGYAGLTNLIIEHEGNPELMEIAREAMDYGGIRASEWRKIVDWHFSRRGAYQGPTIIVGEDPEDTYPKEVWKKRFKALLEGQELDFVHPSGYKDR